MTIAKCLAMLLTIFTAGLVYSAEFHVAPNGNDANPGTKEQPFATLAHARDAAGKSDAKGKEPIRVLLHGGTYYLAETVVFGPDDSGTKECPVTYAACPGERVVLSGGRRIGGWKTYRDKIWQCDLKSQGLGSLVCEQVFYHGSRQPLARVPNVDPKHPLHGGYLYPPGSKETESKTRLEYDPAKFDPRGWAHPELAEVQVYPYHNWVKNRIRVARIDRANHAIELEKPANYTLGYDTRFYVENVFEELDAAGEWYWDRAASTLYFWPPDDKLAEGEVVVPAIDAVIQFRGDAARSVQYVNVVGFTIQECRQTAISANAAHCCVVAKNTITNAGVGGVDVGGCTEVQVLGNDIAHVGASGINISGQKNLASNNYVHDIGEIYGGSAINVGGQENTIAHNLVHDVPALGMGFSGYNNVIEFNEIHHFGMNTNLSGGVYSHSQERENAAKGTILRFNKISDAVGWGMSAPGRSRANPGWGIWLDDWISETTIYGNILVRNVFGGIQVHGGVKNVIENNIMGAGIPSTVNHIRPGTEPCDNRILRNIVYYTNHNPLLAQQFGWTVRNVAQDSPRYGAAPVFLCGWSSASAAVSLSDYNLFFPVQGKNAEALFYFRGAGKAFPTTGKDQPVEDRFAWWRKMGADPHGMVGDPHFVDVAKDDYRLKPNSPALKLGFKPIPIDRIGLYADPYRATWPVDNHQNRPREECRLDLD